MTTILGIVNITQDSFSDGGRYREPAAAIEHARQLIADGADIIDLGAESTHPDSEDVSAADEIERLAPVVRALHSEGITISIDTRKPRVMAAMLSLGVELINDVGGFSDPDAVAAVRDADARLIVMHAISATGRAERTDNDPATIVDRIVVFFERRVSELTSAGIARERLILDPGMGFFLGTRPETSLAVLRNLDRIVTLGLPVLVSTSRKSFVGQVLADHGGAAPVERRATGTLVTELCAIEQGAALIRTHDVRQLRDALRMWEAIRMYAIAEDATRRK